MNELLIHAHEYFVNNFLDVVGFTFTLVAGCFALFQWRDSIKNSRAKYVRDLLHSITDDEKIQRFQRYTDYEKEWYKEEFHDCDESEIATIADKTLFTYNYICYLYDTNVINRKELEIFTYYMLILAHDKELTYYFLDLYQYSIHKKGSFKLFPFEHYLDFCIKNGCISDAVKEEDFFYYYLRSESTGKESVEAGEIPEKTSTLISQVKGHLLIKNVSRCLNCSNYSDEKCRLQKNKDDFYWVGRDKECDQFVFTKGTEVRYY